MRTESDEGGRSVPSVADLQKQVVDLERRLLLSEHENELLRHHARIGTGGTRIARGTLRTAIWRSLHAALASVTYDCPKGISEEMAMSLGLEPVANRLREIVSDVVLEIGRLHDRPTEVASGPVDGVDEDWFDADWREGEAPPEA